MHLGLQEFFPASPRQLHSVLYRTIIGEPGRNEDDLSHCPLVSGSLGAFVVADLLNVSAPGGIEVVGQPIAGVSMTDARWLQPHSVAIGLHSHPRCPAPQVPVTQESLICPSVLTMVNCK